jgi:hypothetical protein
MLWADTTTGLLKQRNAANTGWLVRGTLAETFVIARSSDTILGVGDHGRVIIATSTFTQTVTAAATLGDNWYVGYRNDGTGVITLDPNASETIDGGTTITLQPGEACFIFCNGTAFKTIGRRRINDLTEDTTPDGAADFVETWDVSASAHKKVLLNAASQGAVKLSSGSASGATLDIVMTAFTGWKHKLLVVDLVPASDGEALHLRVSTDGGSTYDATASNYQYAMRAVDDNTNVPTQAAAAGAGATSITLCLNAVIGSGAAEGISSRIWLPNTTDAAKWPRCYFDSALVSADATPRAREAHGVGLRAAAQDTDAVRLFFSVGNIASGSYALYGFKE